MFELSSTQKQAATDAMNGMAPTFINHLILFVIAATVLTWFFFVLVGLWQCLQARQLDLGDVLGKFSLAMFTVICVGVVIVS